MRWKLLLMLGLCLSIVLSGEVSVSASATINTPPHFDVNLSKRLVAEKVDGESIWKKYAPSTAPAKEQATPRPPERQPATVAPQSTPPADVSAAPKPESSSQNLRESADKHLDYIKDYSVYIKETKKVTHELLPTFFNYLSESHDVLLMQLILSVEATEVKFHTQKASPQYFIFECIPEDTSALSKLEKEGLTASEFAAMFGKRVFELTGKLKSDKMIMRTQPTNVAGVHAFEDVYVTADGQYLLASNCMEKLLELKKQRAENVDAFNFPADNNVWAQWTVLAPSIYAKGQTTELSSWIKLNPVALGWEYSYGSSADNFLPPALTTIPPLKLAATEIFGQGKPYFMLALHGQTLALAEAMQDVDKTAEEAAFLKLFSNFSKVIDSMTLTLGGSTGNILGTAVPGVALTLTGDDETLGQIAALFKMKSKAQWIDTNYPQWKSASVTQGSAFDLPIPVPLLVAQKDNVLVMGFMSASSFSQSRQIPSLLDNLPQLKTDGIQEKWIEIPKNISSVYVVDVQQIWQDAVALTAPGSPLRLLSDVDKKDPNLAQVLDHLREQTPPLKAVVNWTDSPNALNGKGYIIISREDSTVFSQTLARFLDNVRYFSHI